MTGARPLKDVFADLLGGGDDARPDPGAALAAAGHPDLPPELVAEAVVSYADSAPVEVAEHLAPYVTQVSGVPPVHEPVPDSGEALTPDLLTLGDLLASAPDGSGVDAVGLDEPPAYELDDLPDGVAPAGPDPTLVDVGSAALDFGGGAEDAQVAEARDAPLVEPLDEAHPELPTEPDVDEVPPLELTLPRPDDGAGASEDLDEDPAEDLDA